jgi:RNA-directed DNA polymerase
MLDRAQQALHLLALEPVSEMLADKNAYGFRPLRSCADAIEQCFTVLALKTSASYILEGDIKACFDSILHSWLEKHVPMDKRILKQWLTAGYLEKGKFHSMEAGTPQGGIISPTLLNIALSGLETAVKTAVPGQRHKINLCIYADDFIITGVTQAILEQRVKPVVEAFLQARGLALSPAKTRITHIDKGFDFLGFTLRKYKSKLLITPAKSSVKRFLADIRETIKRHRMTKTEHLLFLLNPKIRGWTNYYCHVCSKKTFTDISHFLFQALRKWCKQRHPSKSLTWIKQKYYRRVNLRDWVFGTQIKTKSGNSMYVDLVDASHVAIKRHIKFRGEATPYNPAYRDYISQRTTGHKALSIH